jgi:hypothetical protein
VGAPLIVDLENSEEITKREVQMAGTERVQLMGKFFAYHSVGEIFARRLVLTLPPPPSNLPSGKRQRVDTCSQGRREQVMHVCGASFGATLGSICAYLEGRGVPAERAYVLRSIRTQLLPVAEALRSMRGSDVPHLSRGLASCRVVPAQRPYITEPMVRIDSKYGHAHTCIGATATMLTCFGTMATVPDHARHFVSDCSLIKALRCAHAALQYWKVSSTHMEENNWEALAAEKRALERAVAGARQAAQEAEALRLEPTPAIMLQLHWAREAAFPATMLVSQYTQARLMHAIGRNALFTPARECPCTGGMPNPQRRVVAPSTELVDVVPLSQISEALLSDSKRSKRSKRDADDAQSSVGSSSWTTMSNHSHTSSFSHVSMDSLGEVAAPLGNLGV